MKSTINKLNNFTSKMVSKKSLLILSSIILLFLVNACTPLPTGGPVSANRIYKVHNAEFKTIFSDWSGLNESIATDFDLNNDGINDVRFDVYAYGGLVKLQSINNTHFASLNGSIKPFNLLESISNSNQWNNLINDTIRAIYNQSYINYYSEIPTVWNGTTTSIIYIGFKIINGNNENFGWFKLTFDRILSGEFMGGVAVKLIESNYNTIPNQTILAGVK